MDVSLKKRSAYWDNLKGFLILLVVFGHNIYNNELLASKGMLILIYLFHMEAFIFVSGYFSKSENSRNKNSIIKLVVAYLIFNTAMMLFCYVGNNDPINIIEPYNSYWYLLAIIVWRLVVGKYAKLKFGILISIVLAIGIGSFSGVGNQFGISRIISFFPFFLIGYSLNKEKMEKFIQNRKWYTILAGLVLSGAAFGFAGIYIIKKPSISLLGELSMAPYSDFSGFVRRIAIFVLAGIIITGLLCFTPNKKIPLLNKWGRNSLSIYL